MAGAAPVGTTTEVFAWSSSMLFGGAAVGNAAAGWLAQRSGVTSALALCGATGVLALATTLWARPVVRSV